jgi:hypothetical protein
MINWLHVQSVFDHNQQSRVALSADWEKLTPEWAELSGGRKSMGFSRIVTDTDRQIQVKGTCCDGMGRFYSFFVMAGALPTGCCNGGTQADMS